MQDDLEKSLDKGVPGTKELSPIAKKLHNKKSRIKLSRLPKFLKRNVFSFLIFKNLKQMHWGSEYQTFKLRNNFNNSLLLVYYAPKNKQTFAFFNEGMILTEWDFIQVQLVHSPTL